MAKTTPTLAIHHPLLVYLLFLWISIFLIGVVLSGAPYNYSSEKICSEEERNSLLEFKTKLFDPNGILSSWTEGDNCCRWKGISCDEFGIVVMLDLHNPSATDPYDLDFYSFGLSGEIDSSLLSLQNLQHLDLSGNNFSTSSFPSFIGSFKELRYLNLSSTGLAGVIPSQFGNLTSLQFLDLSYNNKLTLEATRGLSFIAHLSSLQYIDISEITLSVYVTDLFQELNSLPSISVIRLNECSIPPTPQSLFPQLNFKNLTVLSLRGNGIFREFNVPDWLFKIDTLEYLDLSFTNPDPSSSRQSNVIPVAIGNLYRLKFLDLSYKRLNGLIPDSIGNLSLLQEIHLQSNNLVGSIPESLGRGLLSLRILDLSDNQLSGSIPESVGRFQSLQQLDLSDNILGGTIPTSIGNLSSLHVLDLSNNSFNGSIPAYLCGLGFLRRLDLSWNSLNGLIPDSIGNLSLLQEIHLESNNLVGSIPESIGRGLLSLRILHLSYNQLSGTIPTSIGNLSSLEELNLQNNELIGPIPESLTALVSLDLSENRFNGSIPVSLCGLEFLRTLDLSWNHEMSGSIPDCVWGLEQLQSLGLGGNGLQGVLSESNFSKLHKLDWLTITASKLLIINVSQDWIPLFSLSELYMQSCKVGPKFPTWIRTQDKLVLLGLEDVGLSENPPDWIWNFSLSLRYIRMSRNEMEGRLPDATYAPVLQSIYMDYNKFEGSNWLSNIWKMMPQVSSLRVAGNNISGTIPSSLCNIALLGLLDLSMNNFSGKIPGCLNLESNNLIGSFPTPNDTQCSLWYLNLEGNSLTGIVPEWLTNCKDLTTLKLGKNKLTGNITTWVAESMPSLTTLDLSRNNLYGRLPPSFKNFKALQKKSTSYGTRQVSDFVDGKLVKMIETIQLPTSIDFSGNQLSGEIPEDIGSLLGLQSLNLSGNHLTGNIPETISRLKALEILDLSINNLSGEIPQSMSSMTTLSHLNLSFNNLSGKIPTGNQFSTFTDPSVFMGNPYLCVFSYRSCGSGQTILPPKGGEQTEDKDKTGMLWVYLNTVLGFVVGFWLFYGTLFFKKTWRCSYFQVLQDFNENLHLRCKRMW